MSGPGRSSSDADRLVRVRRTGGFAGLVTEGAVDLDDGEAPDVAGELDELVARIDAQAAVARPPTHADRYTYDFDLCGRRTTVAEQHLTDDLRRVAELVLDR